MRTITRCVQFTCHHYVHGVSNNSSDTPRFSCALRHARATFLKSRVLLPQMSTWNLLPRYFQRHASIQGTQAAALYHSCRNLSTILTSQYVNCRAFVYAVLMTKLLLSLLKKTPPHLHRLFVSSSEPHQPSQSKSQQLSRNHWHLRKAIVCTSRITLVHRLRRSRKKTTILETAISYLNVSPTDSDPTCHWQISLPRLTELTIHDGFPVNCIINPTTLILCQQLAPFTLETFVRTICSEVLESLPHPRFQEGLRNNVGLKRLIIGGWCKLSNTSEQIVRTNVSNVNGASCWHRIKVVGLIIQFTGNPSWIVNSVKREERDLPVARRIRVRGRYIEIRDRCLQNCCFFLLRRRRCTSVIRDVHTIAFRKCQWLRLSCWDFDWLGWWGSELETNRRWRCGGVFFNSESSSLVIKTA